MKKHLWTVWITALVVLAVLTWWLAGQGNGNQVAAVLTLVLVAITAWYAHHTREMVNEMELARMQDLALRAREKSEVAATACLEVIQMLLAEADEVGAAAVERETYRAAHRRLRNQAVFITDDDELKDHLHACAEVLFVSGFGDGAMRTEELSPGSVRLRANGLARATERALTSYLIGKPRSAWHWDSGSSTSGERELYPSANNAAAWIRNQAKN